MMIDVIAISIIIGIFLILIYWRYTKRTPTIPSVLSMFLYGQSFVYGASFIIYGITGESIYLVDNRWVIAFGGIALVWIGFENYKKDFSEKNDL